MVSSEPLRVLVIEQGRGKFAALDPPHVQLEQARVVRRRGDRKAAPPSAGQHDVDVLAGLEIEGSAAGSLQMQAHDIVRPAAATRSIRPAGV